MRATHFVHALGASVTKRSIVISPTEVSSKTDMASILRRDPVLVQSKIKSVVVKWMVIKVPVSQVQRMFPQTFSPQSVQ